MIHDLREDIDYFPLEWHILLLPPNGLFDLKIILVVWESETYTGLEIIYFIVTGGPPLKMVLLRCFDFTVVLA